MMKKQTFEVDLTKPRSRRPMTGLDIEEWRADRGMTKYDTQYALGFRNSNHYNKMCLKPILPAELELLIRLYEESPLITGPGWEKYSLPALFNLMYGNELAVFSDTRDATYAKVDLGTRFTKMFNRSSPRQYQWLDEAATRNESEINAYAVMERILAKLHHVDDPKGLLERVARKVWFLRGFDLDAVHPVPTPDSPPTRQKTGRKSRILVGGARKSARLAKPPVVEKVPASGPVGKAAAAKTVSSKRDPKKRDLVSPESALVRAAKKKVAPAKKSSAKQK